MSGERGTSYEGTPPEGAEALPVGERRVALVIGNGAYAHALALENPSRDAAAVAELLTSIGFDVVKGINLDLRAIGDVQAAFEDKLRGKPDVALLFYAGHGLQVDGRNYLIPVDAEITQKAHLASRALLFNDLLEEMTRKAGASLILLDACRDNPFTRNLARSAGEVARHTGARGGLARIEKVAGTFIAYATAPDTVAYDGKGANSPFTSALLRHIPTPGLSIGDMMIDVRNSVLAETGGRQEPWDQSSLRARFYFVPKRTTPPAIPLKTLEAATEWNAIQQTASLAVLARYKERYPEQPWSHYAEDRAAELRDMDKQRQENYKDDPANNSPATEVEQPAALDFLQNASLNQPLNRKEHRWGSQKLLAAVGLIALLAMIFVAAHSWLPQHSSRLEPAQSEKQKVTMAPIEKREEKVAGKAVVQGVREEVSRTPSASGSARRAPEKVGTENQDALRSTPPSSIITKRRVTTEMVAGIDSLVPARPVPAERPEARAARSYRPLIMIDPVFGGEDGGLSGNGALEKSIALAVGLLLNEQLKETGRYKVLMTRDADVSVPLGERVDFAIRHNAVVYLNLRASHLPAQNGSTGIRLYTLNSEGFASLLNESGRESVLSGGEIRALGAGEEGNIGKVRDILKELQDRERSASRSRSVALSQAIAKVAIERGIKTTAQEVNLEVLRLFAAAVAVDLGNIAEAGDAKIVSQPQWQAKIAKMIVAAIDTFFTLQRM